LVEVEYLSRSPIYVRGTATGAAYQFSAAVPIQRMHRDDAKVLLGTRHFRLARRSAV